MSVSQKKSSHSSFYIQHKTINLATSIDCQVVISDIEDLSVNLNILVLARGTSMVKQAAAFMLMP